MLKLLIELVGFFTILLTSNSKGQPAYLEEAQLIKPLSNVWIPCSSSAMMASISCSYKNVQQVSARSNQPKKILVKTTLTHSTASALFQVPVLVYTCLIQQRRPAENYKTLHKLVFLGKLLGKTTKKPVEGTISKLLLWEVTYKMLPLLLTIQELFQ